jgi:hypothetical protein
MGLIHWIRADPEQAGPYGIHARGKKRPDDEAVLRWSSSSSTNIATRKPYLHAGRQ